MLGPLTGFFSSSSYPFNLNVFSENRGKAQGGPQNLAATFPV
jgi:hypothetical protein